MLGGIFFNCLVVGRHLGIYKTDQCWWDGPRGAVADQWLWLGSQLCWFVLKKCSFRRRHCKSSKRGWSLRVTGSRVLADDFEPALVSGESGCLNPPPPQLLSIADHFRQVMFRTTLPKEFQDHFCVISARKRINTVNHTYCSTQLIFTLLL